MQQYKEDFIKFMIDCDVLKFGSFVTKSGRNTPFFINAGNFSTGSAIRKLGSFYAKSIMDIFKDDVKKGIDVIFGPAYKGITLSVTAAASLYEEFDVDVRYASNRKEIKDHGEGGKLLGGPINENDRVLIIEDVTTAGTSIKETYPIITKTNNVDVFGLIVCVDRMEKGQTDKSAVAQIEEEYNLKAGCIVNMAEIVEYLYKREYKGRIIIDDELKSSIDEYYNTYGAGYFG